MYEEWPHKDMSPYFTEDAVVVIRKSADFSKGLWSLRGKKLCMPSTSESNIQFQVEFTMNYGCLPSFPTICC